MAVLVSHGCNAHPAIMHSRPSGVTGPSIRGPLNGLDACRRHHEHDAAGSRHCCADTTCSAAYSLRRILKRFGNRVAGICCQPQHCKVNLTICSFRTNGQKCLHLAQPFGRTVWKSGKKKGGGGDAGGME